MKLCLKFVFLLILATFLPTELWAQQPAQTANTARPRPLTPEEMRDTPWPNDPTFDWTKERQGIDPLVPPEMIPGWGKGSEDQDKDIMQKVLLGEKGYEDAAKLIYEAIGLEMHDDPVPERGVVEQIKAIARVRKFVKSVVSPSTQFVCRMPFGGRQSDGKFRARLGDVPRLVEPDPLDVYLIGPIMPTVGPFAYKSINFVIPKVCMNITCIKADAQVQGLNPAEPEVKTGKFEITKRWYNLDGKKIDAPSRRDVQAHLEITPVAGGSAINFELKDNEEAKGSLAYGVYDVREVTDSPRWRLQGEAVRTLNIGEAVAKLTLDNYEVGTDTRAAPPPTTVQTTGFKEKKGGHKKLWTAIGIAGSVAAVALFTPRGERVNITMQGQKGYTGPGATTTYAPATFGVQYAFAGGM